MRFRPSALTTVRTNTICMGILFDPLSRPLSNRRVFNENAQRISGEDTTKNILYVNQYKIVGETAHHLPLPPLTQR